MEFPSFKKRESKMNTEMPKMLFQIPTKMYFLRFIDVPPSKFGKLVVREREILR
jgi:hypothetical protein